jgi:arabinogalactan endo-1,4-beta-galactosidase
MRKLFSINLFIIVSMLLLMSCDDEQEQSPGLEPITEVVERVYAVDISSFPEIDEDGTTFFEATGNQKSFLEILSDSGVNTIRLRLWVNPVSGHSSLDEVRNFSTVLKQNGFKVWLTLHYSDTWADPGHQETPSVWGNQNIGDLTTTVYNYTSQVMQEIQPDYIQIGNEINSGMLHPLGNISTSKGDFLQLLAAGSDAVRDNSTNTQIIIHFAGIEGSTWFYDQLASVDYDIIGLSYYPIWHGKSLTRLEDQIKVLSSVHDKKIIIAETAYPFTLGFNDFTNNILGLNSQLILPQYPATAQGQSDFLWEIKLLSTNFDRGLGFCYWGGELVAWKGEQAVDASPWENQALFDFDNTALPVLNVFSE